MLNRFWRNYLQRHMHPVNRGLHVVGVPLTFVGTPLCLLLPNYGFAVGCFVGGYVLQFAGHAIEKNDAGEVILIKKWLKQPYTEFGPAGNESKFDG